MWFVFTLPSIVVLAIIFIIAGIGYGLIQNLWNIFYTLLLIIILVDAVAGLLLIDWKSKRARTGTWLRCVTYIFLSLGLHILRDTSIVQVDGTVLLLTSAGYVMLTVLVHKILQKLEVERAAGLQILLILLTVSSVSFPFITQMVSDMDGGQVRQEETTHYVVTKGTDMFGYEIQTKEVADFKKNEMREIKLQYPNTETVKWKLKQGDVLKNKKNIVEGYCLVQMTEAPYLTGFVHMVDLKAEDTF